MIDFTHKTYRLDNDTFLKISHYINFNYGIQLPPSKKLLVESRLQKRLKRLRITSFSDYGDYVFSSQGKKEELVHMVDIITTNKTDFFRESDHFDYLYNTILPTTSESRTSAEYNVWSSGCSSGEEPYSLAMVLNEFKEKTPHFNYKIRGTDISSVVLKKAKRAIYTESDIAPIPMALRRKYLLKSCDRKNLLIKIKPEIQNQVHFDYLNLMEDQYAIHKAMDIIFFRNVSIYFDKPTQELMINKICKHLKPKGYLFIGHSESLYKMNVPVKQVCSTIYRKIK